MRTESDRPPFSAPLPRFDRLEGANGDPFFGSPLRDVALVGGGHRHGRRQRHRHHRPPRLSARHVHQKSK